MTPLTKVCDEQHQYYLQEARILDFKGGYQKAVMRLFPEIGLEEDKFSGTPRTQPILSNNTPTPHTLI